MNKQQKKRMKATDDEMNGKGKGKCDDYDDDGKGKGYGKRVVVHKGIGKGKRDDEKGKSKNDGFDDDEKGKGKGMRDDYDDEVKGKGKGKAVLKAKFALPSDFESRITAIYSKYKVAKAQTGKEDEVAGLMGQIGSMIGGCILSMLQAFFCEEVLQQVKNGDRQVLQRAKLEIMVLFHKIRLPEAVGKMVVATAESVIKRLMEREVSQWCGSEGARSSDAVQVLGQ